MKTRFPVALLLALSLAVTVFAQDQNPPQDQNTAPQAGPYGRRGGRGFGGMGMVGRGVTGTVTEAAAGHFTVKTFQGDTYTVNFSDNTRFMKMQGGGGMGGGMGRRGMGGNPPQPIKASDIKTGDAIAARGEVDASEKTVGALGIMLLDPQVAQRIQQMAADYGKTWLMGHVTAIEGTKVTLMGSQDNAAHTFVVNENTDFRERRNPITLADIKVGDMVRVQGALSGGTFTASNVNVMRMPQGGGSGPGGPNSGGGPPN